MSLAELRRWTLDRNWGERMKQDVREYAAEKEIGEQAALGVGMKDKAEEFVESGGRFIRRLSRYSAFSIDSTKAAF